MFSSLVRFVLLLGALLLCGVQAHAQAEATALRINGIYRGDDGSAFYLMRRGSEVFAFAEHPGQHYAFVARGSVAGDRIQADWWDVPKGSRSDKGRIELQITQGGRRLHQTAGTGFGATRLDRIDPAQVPWPGRQEAGFQKSGPANLTGAYEADDGSRWYVRAAEGDTVGVVEAAAPAGQRPAFVSVFFGRPAQADDASFAGPWSDVPKGVQAKQGRIGAAMLKPDTAVWNRDITVSLTGVNRARRLEPDYAVDLQAMGRGIEAVMQSSGAVGWAYAIASPAGIVKKGAGGLRQQQVDGANRAFSTRTQAQAASFTKTVTAIVLAKALHDRGLSFQTKLEPFLPKCWKRGPGVRSLSFGDLASHNTGFEPAGSTPYQMVKQTIENGNKRPPTGFVYRNDNYRVMRYLVPLVAEREKALAIFDKWDCKDSRGDEINAEISLLFARALLSKTFSSAIAAGMDFVPTGGDFSLNYNWQDATVAGSPPNPDAAALAGAGYLALLAESAVLMLRALDAGDIVPRSWARTMKQSRYGFDSWYKTKAGYAAWKNGGCAESAQGHDCAAWGVVFPGRTYAYLVMNSGRRKPDTSATANLGAIIESSYDAAFR